MAILNLNTDIEQFDAELESRISGVHFPTDMELAQAFNVECGNGNGYHPEKPLWTFIRDADDEQANRYIRCQRGWEAIKGGGLEGLRPQDRLNGNDYLDSTISMATIGTPERIEALKDFFADKKFIDEKYQSIMDGPSPFNIPTYEEE